MPDDTSRRSVPFSRASELTNAIGTSASDERLHDWVSDDPSRASLLDGKIVGTISWSHELGRPDRPRLADGFIIIFHFEPLEETAGPSGTPAPTVEAIDTPPSELWERDDGDRYVVGFLGDFQSRFGDNTVSVALSNVPWRDRSPHFGARTVVPPHTAPFPTKRAGFAAFSFGVIGTGEFESPVHVAR
jgi:hypothetical protein